MDPIALSRDLTDVFKVEMGAQVGAFGGQFDPAAGLVWEGAELCFGGNGHICFCAL